MRGRVFLAVMVTAVFCLAPMAASACGPAGGGGTVFSFNAGPAYSQAFVAQQAFVQPQAVYGAAFAQPQAVILQNRVHRRPIAFAPVRRSAAAFRGAVRGFARGY